MDILTIGQCTMDLYLKLPNSTGISSLFDTGPNICFLHGSKNEVEKFEMTPGGNALNVAIGTKKLGLKAEIYSEMGSDAYADEIIKTLKSHLIDTTLCVKNKGGHTNISSIIVRDGERTIFAYHQKQEYVFRKWGTPKMIYYTSIPQGYENFQKILCQYVKVYPETMLAFNPGTLHFKNGIGSFREVLSVTDILFVNKEEAIVLTKDIIGSSKTLEQLHKGLLELGPKLTVITDGKNGASAHTGAELIEIKSVSDKRPVLDKTGAGDAFNAGFLAGIHYKRPLKEALLWGAINSGNAIKEVGAVNGLLTRPEIETILRKM